MSLRFRRRIRTSPNTWLNVSKTGVSGSVKAGRVTYNTRRGLTIRLGKGLSWRIGQ